MHSQDFIQSPHSKHDANPDSDDWIWPLTCVNTSISPQKHPPLDSSRAKQAHLFLGEKNSQNIVKIYEVWVIFELDVC